MVTTALTLVRFLLDKSSQSRRLVQMSFIESILREGRQLLVSVLDLLDGMPVKDKALRSLYSIQRLSVVVGFLERDNRRGSGDRKKKNYGFCPASCAYIDELCDDLIGQISAYDQCHPPYRKGQDESVVEI